MNIWQKELVAWLEEATGYDVWAERPPQATALSDLTPKALDVVMHHLRVRVPWGVHWGVQFTEKPGAAGVGEAGMMGVWAKLTLSAAGLKAKAKMQEAAAEW